MTLTSLAPRIPVDPAGLEAAHRVVLSRIEAERLAPVRKPRRQAWRWAALVTGVAGATAVVVSLPSAGDAPAFAGWTAVPAPIGPRALEARGQDCVDMRMSDVNAGLGPEVPFDLPGARPVIAEQRGSISLTVVAGPPGVLVCTVGPQTRKTSELRAVGGGDTIEGGSGGSYQSVQGSEAWTSEPPAAGTVGLVLWNQQYVPEPWYSVVGRVGAGVREVEVSRTEGPDVTATVANGFFVAWWPGDAAGSSVVPVLDDGSKGEPMKLDVVEMSDPPS
jgi:hypothetical protein